MDLADRITDLDSTTFCGRRFSRAQIRQVIDTASTFVNLSRHQLALTMAAQLMRGRWPAIQGLNHEAWKPCGTGP